MNYEEFSQTRHLKPVCIGTGLVALDIIINGNPNLPPKRQAGGSCGNVLTILSYLGWESYPLARLGNDTTSTEVMQDIEKWGVKTCLISRDSNVNTPIIIERIEIKHNGIPIHRFEQICPNCGSWLPRYKPVLIKAIEQISKKLPKSEVFYFDRVSRSSVELAKFSKDHGALIVFEPTGIKDKKLFFECLQIADIVKYSHEKLGNIKELTQKMNIKLEIETFGAKGLRYRFNNNIWKTIHACSVKNFKDAAGAGDWCSAGIIYLLGNTGREGFKNDEEKNIESALNFGQALAALNCYYEGARGIMYNMSKDKFENIIVDIWNHNDQLESIEEKEIDPSIQISKSICPYCG